MYSGCPLCMFNGALERLEAYWKAAGMNRSVYGKAKRHAMVTRKMFVHWGCAKDVSVRRRE